MKKIVLFLILFAQMSWAQTPIHSFSFNNTLSNEANTASFATANGITYTTGRHGDANGAININQTSTSATLTGLPYGNASRTISVWVKMNSFNNNVNQFNPVFHYGHPILSSGSPAFNASVSAENIRLYYGTNLSVQYTSGTITPSQWVHLVFVYNGTFSQLQFYKNGVLFSSVSPFNINTVNYNDIFTLGAGVSVLGSFNGAIDDLKIYDQALTASQIITLYNPNTPPTGLLYHHTFNGKVEEEYARAKFTEPNVNIFTTGVTMPNAAINIAPGAQRTATFSNVPTGNSARTVAVWLRLVNHNAINWWYGSQNSNQAFGMTIYNSPNFIRIFGWANDFDISQTVNGGEWNHFVITHDGTTLRVYRNGTLIGSSNRTYNTALNSGTFNISNGQFDDLRVYDYALTASEVTDLFNNSLSNADFYSHSSSSIILYPNPTNSIFNLKIPNEIIKTIKVYDFAGKELLTTNQQQVDVSNLSVGIYIVKAETESGKTGTTKLIKN
jgi:hypothetical protein